MVFGVSQVPLVQKYRWDLFSTVGHCDGGQDSPSCAALDFHFFMFYARSDNGHLNAPRAAPITTLSWRLRVTPLSHRATKSSLLPLLLHNTADTSAAEASSFSGNVTAEGHSATDSPK